MSAVSLALISGAVAADKPQAFVLKIEIEAYFDHINKIGCGTEHSIWVVHTFSVITEIETERSRILIANRVWNRPSDAPPAKVAVSADTHQHTGITRALLTDIVEVFQTEQDTALSAGVHLSWRTRWRNGGLQRRSFLP